MRTGRAHILELLGSIRPLAEQIKRQGRQDGLLGEVRALLPVPERAHCTCANRNGATLILTVDAATWATRIRYRIPGLLAALAPLGVSTIKTRIQPPGQGPLGPSPRRAAGDPARKGALSAKVVRHLTAAADEIGDPGLAEVLRRLARRHGGSDLPPTGT